MVAMEQPATANGATKPQNGQTDQQLASNAQPGDVQDATSLQDELAAAATYLQSLIDGDDSNVATTITTDAEDGDVIGATSKLIDLFLAALDAPADPDGPSSLEGCMQEVLVWIRKKCEMNATLVDKLSNGLCAGTSSPSLRLRCMGVLYNSVDERDSNQRFKLLLATITLSKDLKLISAIVDTILPKLESYMRRWDVQVEDKRRMYKVCYKALKSSSMAHEAFSYNVKLLTLYNGCSESELDAVRTETVDVIVQAVRLPKLYRFDTLLELDSVTRLQNVAEKEFNLLYELICIFVRDDLAIFREFRKKNEELLVKYDIDAEVAVEKMRLLTFASLGIESPDLTYDMIASALQIEEKDVEHWVIRAISSGLVDAKINQLKSSVAIYRSTQRMFTREEWLPLSERINIWKENIGDLLVALRETRDASGIAAVEAFSG